MVLADWELDVVQLNRAFLESQFKLFRKDRTPIPLASFRLFALPSFHTFSRKTVRPRRTVEGAS